MSKFVPALLVVSLLGVGAAAGRRADPDPVVARVNDWAIRRSDLARLSESLPAKEPAAGDPQRARYLTQAVQEEVLFQWAVRPRATVERALREKLRAATFQHLLETRVRPRVRVSDAEVAAYYEDNLDRVRGAHVRVRRIYRARPNECEPLRAQTGSDEEFVAAARRLSQDPASAAEGGDLGPVFPAPGPLGFERELFTMRAGESRVFRDGKGCSLVRVVERIDPPIPPLDDVRDSLRTFLETRRAEQLLEELVREARKTVKVRLFLNDSGAKHPAR